MATVLIHNYLYSVGDDRLNKVLRQEHKYLITLDQAAKLRARLNEVMRSDTHNGLEGYMVRSLYFDTLFNSDFTQKVDGVDLRKKMRLRIYSPDDKFAKLEMKQKQSTQQLKRSLDVRRELATQLADGRYSGLLGFGRFDSFASECFAVLNEGCYRPKAIVEYKREAFTASENNTRITLDRCISATESCTELFAHQLLCYPVYDQGLVVLEVKYDGFLLGYVKRLLDNVERSQLSMSKYCVGRSASMGCLL